MRFTRLLAIIAVACSSAVAQAQEVAQIDLLPGLMLYDQNGNSHTSKDSRGKYTLVHLGFSRCKKECPASLALMSQVLKKLGADAEKLRVMFISLDPGDTADSLTAMLAPYDKRILALHGDQAEINKLIENYQLYTATTVNTQTGTSMIGDHAPNLYLFSQGAQYLGDFTPLESADDIAEDIRKVVGQGKVVRQKRYFH